MTIRTGTSRAWTAALILLAACAAGCVSPFGRSYESPADAAEALVAAIRSRDETGLRAVLGPRWRECVDSGDEVSDGQDLERFLSAYEERHAIVDEGEGRKVLVVGEAEWPMPIPILRKGSAWRFDTATGIEEIHAHRIGRNELAAIEVCRAAVDAQFEYLHQDPDGDGRQEFAGRFRSSPGQRDGLYWEAAEGEPESPLGSFAAEAHAQGYGVDQPSGDPSEPRPYHGYRYRLLTEQGPSAAGGARTYLDGERLVHGFAIVAWPASYGESGIMTFLINHNGVVFERDLGTDTDAVALAMTAFDPDADWSILLD